MVYSTSTFLMPQTSYDLTCCRIPTPNHPTLLPTRPIPVVVCGVVLWLVQIRVLFLNFHLIWRRPLILGSRVIVPRTGRWNELYLVTHITSSTDQTLTPRLLTSLRTASIPFLSIILSPLRDIRNRTHRFSLSTQNLRTCKLGLNNRLFRLLAWDTLFPDTDRLPVI